MYEVGGSADGVVSLLSTNDAGKNDADGDAIEGDADGDDGEDDFDGKRRRERR